MESTFTLKQLADFTRKEEELLNELGLIQDVELDHLEPRKHIVDNILNYSKALSVRKTKILGNVEMVLN